MASNDSKSPGHGLALGDELRWLVRIAVAVLGVSAGPQLVGGGSGEPGTLDDVYRRLEAVQAQQQAIVLDIREIKRDVAALQR